MKQAAVILTVLFCLLSVSPTARAEEPVSLSLTIGEDVQAGKAFDLHLSVQSPVPVGVARIHFTYDGEALTLKSITTAHADDKVVYNLLYGEADIIYFPQSQGDILLHCKPADTQTREYTFEASLGEVGDVSACYLQTGESCRFSLHISESSAVIRQQASASSRSSSTNSCPVSQKESSAKADKSPSSQQTAIPSSDKEELPSETADTEEEVSEQAAIYRVIHEEKPADQNHFLLFAGGLLLLAVCLGAVYRKGFRNGKETQKKSNKS